MQASHLHPLLIIDTNIAPRSLYTDTRIEHIKGGCKEGLASAFSIGICKKNLMNVQESLLREETEQNTGSNSRANHTCHVGSHGVHEEVVVGVCLQSFVLGDAGCHWNG